MADPDRILPPSGGVGEFEAEFAIDWDHLSLQTFADGDLQIELLTLFDSQAADAVARLAESAGEDQNRAGRDLAHTLKGSARAVGAFALGAAAEAYEAALSAGAGDLAERLRDLERALRQAREEIASRLERR